jgi:hypothetical protein
MTVAYDFRDASFVVELDGMSAFAALLRELRIPLSDVTSARVMHTADARHESSMWRWGTSMPGVIRAGRFGRGEHKQFWYVHRAARVLVVDVDADGGASDFSRIVLEVDDPDDLAELINAARVA